MIVKVINITSFVGISGGAEHYYASIREVETNKTINSLIDAGYLPSFNDTNEDRLERAIPTEEEAAYLNKKDSWKGWKVGKLTERFNSEEEIRESASKMFPELSIIFTHFHEVSRHVIDVIDRTEYTYKKTGKKLVINGFTGFSREFVNLTEGSEHEILETPEEYLHKTNLMDGYWVMGVTEPVLVLINECDVL